MSSPQLRWKSSSARAVAGPRMPSTLSAVETQAGQPGLQRAHIVATLEGCHQAQGAITEAPRRFDEGQPRRLVAVPVVVQAAVALEGAHGILGRRAELAGLGARRGVTGGAEPTLEIADRVAVLTAGQLVETRNSSSSWSSWDLPLAPTRRLCTSPPEKTRRVGMLITL